MSEEFLPTVMEAEAPEGWSLGYVTIMIERPECKRLPVEAWRRGPFAIHGRQYWGDDEERQTESVLTHAPTGLRISSFGSADIAAEFAAKIEPLGDWEGITAKQERGCELFFKVRDVLDQIQGDVGTGKQP
jgi:hypothetical protein